MRYDLVFEGGGAKGIAHVGALAPFLQRHTFGRLIGTSAGGIVAAMLVAGYDAAGMRAAISEEVNGKPVLASFLQVPGYRPIPGSSLPVRLLQPLFALFPLWRHWYSLNHYGGWYASDALVAWLTARLDHAPAARHTAPFSRLTLGQLYAETGHHLTLIGADTTTGNLLILNHNTTPDCPLIAALRITASVPLLWQEVVWQAAWGRSMGEEVTGHRMVDGGIVSSFPIELLLSADPQIMALMGPPTGNPVLGFLLDEALPVPGAPPRPDSNWWQNRLDLPLDGRLMALLETMTQAQDRLRLRLYANRVVRLPVGDYGMTEFDMSVARREALLHGADRAMRRFLDRMGEFPFAPTPHLLGENQAAIDQIARQWCGLPESADSDP